MVGKALPWRLRRQWWRGGASRYTLPRLVLVHRPNQPPPALPDAAAAPARATRRCREILRNSPTALRVLKSALNAAEDGQAGIQQLGGDATLLFYQSEEGNEVGGWGGVGCGGVGWVARVGCVGCADPWALVG